MRGVTSLRTVNRVEVLGIGGTTAKLLREAHSWPSFERRFSGLIQPWLNLNTI